MIIKNKKVIIIIICFTYFKNPLYVYVDVDFC